MGTTYSKEEVIVPQNASGGASNVAEIRQLAFHASSTNIILIVLLVLCGLAFMYGISDGIRRDNLRTSIWRKRYERRRDNNGYSYILTLQCELSKYVCAYPLVTKSSTEVACSFVNNFILQYGVPREIATDKGTEFMSDTMKQVCELLHIKKLNSTAYHHQSIGALENSHKNLCAFLRIQTENRSDTWSTWLPFWSFAYNTSVHSSTQFSPFELVYGKIFNLPNNITKCLEPLYNHDNYPFELKYRLQVSQTEARRNLIANKLDRKSRYDKYTNPIRYKNCDKVLLKNETGNKLNQLYSGPYNVIRDLSPNVEIEINGKSNIVHKNRTKLYYV